MKTNKTIYLFQISVEATYYTVHCQYSSRPADIEFTRYLGFSQRSWCRFQSSGVWLLV